MGGGGCHGNHTPEGQRWSEPAGQQPWEDVAQPNNSLPALSRLLSEFPPENREQPRWKILIFQGHVYFFFN